MASASEQPEPPALSRADILTDVFALATTFSTCVEAFNLIHPHRDSDRAQKVALARLGIQQGRLLIFGDAVGISSPPATIARHMVPSHPGLTNPDPTLPVNFGQRDARLDEHGTRQKVRDALDQIAGRPLHLTREQLMERYGLKQPRRFSSIEHPALDTNRLEAFREKYALLQDVVRQSGLRTPAKRSASITLNHWTVKDVRRFDAFVSSVRVEVDGLIALLGVKEQVDRGMRTDIKAMAWHPDLSSFIVRKDWEKLRLIREAVVDDYPEYVDVADRALKYISEELRESKLQGLKLAYTPPPPRKTSDTEEGLDKSRMSVHEHQVKTPDKEKRPGFWSRLSHRSRSSNSFVNPKYHSKSVASPSVQHEEQQTPRSLSDATPQSSDPIDDDNALTTVRSKSLSAIADEPAPFNLDSRIETEPSAAPSNGHTSESVIEPSTLTQVPTYATAEDDDVDPLDTRLVPADTAHSLIDRHDMYKGMGRIDTLNIREKSKSAAAG